MTDKPFTLPELPNLADNDGDGVKDAAYSDFIDTDGDGYGETTLGDENLDGILDTVLLDTDFDGVDDTVVIDVEFDGTFDEVWTDTDGDGTFDTVQSLDATPFDVEGDTLSVEPVSELTTDADDLDETDTSDSDSDSESGLKPEFGPGGESVELNMSSDVGIDAFASWGTEVTPEGGDFEVELTEAFEDVETSFDDGSDFDS